MISTRRGGKRYIGAGFSTSVTYSVDTYLMFCKCWFFIKTIGRPIRRCLRREWVIRWCWVNGGDRPGRSGHTSEKGTSSVWVLHCAGYLLPSYSITAHIKQTSVLGSAVIRYRTNGRFWPDQVQLLLFLGPIEHHDCQGHAEMIWNCRGWACVLQGDPSEVGNTMVQVSSLCEILLFVYSILKAG